MTTTLKNFAIFALVALVTLSLALPALAARPDFAIKERPTLPTQAQAQAADEVVVKFKNSQQPFEVVKVKDVPAAIEAYSKNPNVEYVEPNYIMTALATVNDPYFGYQWNFGSYDVTGGVGAEAVWDVTTGSNDVVVAVIDTGVAYEDYSVRKRRVVLEDYAQAPDLTSTCFTAGYDFVNGDTHPNDDHGHGTHVAGTVAGSANDGYGVAGLAYNTCIMPVKVLNAAGSGYTSDIAAGVRFAADNGADVINLSLGGGSYSQTMVDALAYAYNKGVTIVAATGNDADDATYVPGTVSYPAAYDDYVIAVGATSYAGAMAPYSNYGNAVDIVAPGGDTRDENNDGYIDGILQQTLDSSPQNDFGFFFYTGTSMATPHVAAAAALLKSVDSTLTPAEVRAALESSARDLGVGGWDQYYGHGLLDISAALDSLGTVEPPAPTPNQAPTADFTYTTNGLVVDFTDVSTDDDGTVVSWDWDFGDTGTASTQNPSHEYVATGTYTVLLIVTDNDGATSTFAQDVVVDDTAVEPPVVPDTVLSYTQDKVKGTMYVNLNWTPATTAMDVYRNGATVAQSISGDTYTDSPGKGGGIFVYQVCETGTSVCSNEVTVTF